ncbi:hypothetical protein KEM55_004568 [Ascosphaera atra]|nr:hypothetical protein KEM55_004568 [Ascosphaera atra]
MRLCTLILAIFAAIVVKLLRARRKRQRYPALAYDPVQDCRAIIEAKEVPGLGQNMLTPEASRAIPNKRLEVAFGITNAFTTDDVNFIHGFRAHVADKLKLSEQRWCELGLRVKTMLPKLIHEKRATNLSLLMQSISLRLALDVLFEVPIDQPTEHDVKVIAGSINDIWAETKQSSGKNILPFSGRKELHGSLRNVFPDLDPFDAVSNPLTKIIPAFETIWRVTLRIYLECKPVDEWSEVLRNFSEYPTKEIFEKLLYERQTVSAKDIVHEGFRLYPPTKRVHRAFHLREPSGETKEITARGDIEAAHLQDKRWGDSNAETFDPTRWQKHGLRHSDILTFGTGQFTCPAKAVFGPRAVALLVGSLLSETRCFELCEHPSAAAGTQKFCRDDRRLDNSREGYLDLLLIPRGLLLEKEGSIVRSG